MADIKNRDKNGASQSILRHSAEEKLAKSQDATLELREKSPEEIIHEFRVHQIELEMQNEELRRFQLALEQSKDKDKDLYDFAPIVGYFTLTHTGGYRCQPDRGLSLSPWDASSQIDWARFWVPFRVDRIPMPVAFVLGRDEKGISHECTNHRPYTCAVLADIHGHRWVSLLLLRSEIRCERN